ncbi:hypothetical protein E2C01_067971 [Portunus trituberculatus]|uniref:Uncharacterized protein n=1 Tax=Portunus trituberculatus TaxID=210409 RepID=A0A5B7HV31_PORTR|nr:hypothetical protein [Portunus trituberculatus]
MGRRSLSKYGPLHHTTPRHGTPHHITQRKNIRAACRRGITHLLQDEHLHAFLSFKATAFPFPGRLSATATASRRPRVSDRRAGTVRTAGLLMAG